MNRSRSFRSRLIWGTLLALLGMLALAYVFALHAFRSPRQFIFGHTILFGSLAAAFVLGGLLSIRRGLSEFNQLRASFPKSTKAGNSGSTAATLRKSSRL